MKFIFFVRSPCSIITAGIDFVFFWNLFTIYLSPEGLNEIKKIFKILFFVRSPCSVITPGIDRVFFWMLFTIYLEARRFWVHINSNQHQHKHQIDTEDTFLPPWTSFTDWIPASLHPVTKQSNHVISSFLPPSTSSISSYIYFLLHFSTQIQLHLRFLCPHHFHIASFFNSFPRISFVIRWIISYLISTHWYSSVLGSRLLKTP